MYGSKKRKLFVLPGRLELVLVALNIFVLLVIDFLIYQYLFPYLQVSDKILSGWDLVVRWENILYQNIRTDDSRRINISCPIYFPAAALCED